MIKVKATDASFYYKKKLAEFNRVVYPGEVFEVTEARYDVLHGNNKYGLIFVEKVEEVEEVKATTETIKTEIVTEQEPEVVVINPGEEPEVVTTKTSKKKKSSKA